jgi:hypothetical protein
VARPRTGQRAAPLDFDRLCRFLHEVDRWLTSARRDVRRIRDTLANVERRAWGERGSISKRLCRPARNRAAPPINLLRQEAVLSGELWARLAALDEVIRARDG